MPQIKALILKYLQSIGYRILSTPIHIKRYSISRKTVIINAYFKHFTDNYCF
jgi:hypothetical protein